MLLAPGVVVAGRYRLKAPLGRGGMGAVWSATHIVTRRELALKFLRGPAHARAELRRRFLREARAACVVQHPNVVPVHDVLEHDPETPVMVMDLLVGETLGDRLRRVETLSVAETATLISQVVSAIGTAHARGVVHRDIKPDNIYLEARDGGETVRVLDFGVAKLSRQAEAGTTSVTRTGALMGTPCYMAPEQALGERDVDHRADVWALGAVLYECLSGARPIEGESVGQVVMHLMKTGIAPLCRIAPDVPTDLGELIDRMLARDRARRPADLREVLAVLSHHTELTVRAFGAPGSELAESSRPEETVAPFFDDEGGAPAQPRIRARTAMGALAAVGLVGVLASATSGRSDVESHGARASTAPFVQPPAAPSGASVLAPEIDAAGPAPMPSPSAAVDDSGSGPGAPPPAAPPARSTQATAPRSTADGTLAPAVSAATTSPAPTSASTATPVMGLAETPPY